MIALGLGLGFGARAGGGGAPTIVLSASSILESAAPGSTVGVLSVVNSAGPWTFSILSDPGSKFSVTGADLKLAAALDYETKTSHQVTIQADNGVDDPISRTFTIAVGNVYEQPSLSALSLDDTDIPENAAATINILGATAGSTITLASGDLPTGMSLDSAARTISGTPTVLGSASFTLRETLADSPNSPRDTVLGIEVAEVEETGPTSIDPPILLLNGNTYPPSLNALLNETVLEDDTLQVQASESVGFGTLLFTANVVLDDDLISSGAIEIEDFDSIESPDQTYFRARVIRGIEQSAWSPIIKHGDTTPPVVDPSRLTLSVDENTENFSWTWLANEEIAKWEIVTGGDSVKFSNDGPVVTLNETPDYETQTIYTFQGRATDYAGLSTTFTQIIHVNDIVESTPSVLSSVYKSPYLILSNNDLTVTSANANVGALTNVRSNQARSGKLYFEVTNDNSENINFSAGVCTENFNILGFGVNPGLNGATYRSDGYVFSNNGSNGPLGIRITSEGDIVGVCVDTNNHKIWFSKNGIWISGDPTTGTGGYTLPEDIENVFVWLAIMTTGAGITRQLTVNVGASVFAYTIPDGAVAFN